MTKECIVKVYEAEKLRGILRCAAGERLLDILQDHGYQEQAPCGGRGLCGACGVQIAAGAPLPGSSDRNCFTPEQLRDGMRLSCTVQVKGDMDVVLPKSRTDPDVLFKTTIRSGGHEGTFVKTGENRQSGIWENGQHDGADAAHAGNRPNGGADAAHAGNRPNGGADAAHAGDKPNDAENRLPGAILAVDIGTTTIAMELKSTKGGETLGQYAALNPQRRFGADVLSRIEAAVSSKETGEVMKEQLWTVLRQGIAYFEKSVPDHMAKDTPVFIAGNTTMEHLFMGHSVEALGKYPFTPVTLDWQETVCDGYRVVLLPGFSAFIGADITAGAAALGMLGTAAEPATHIKPGTGIAEPVWHMKLGAGIEESAAHMKPGTAAIPAGTAPMETEAAPAQLRAPGGRLLIDLGTNAEMVYMHEGSLTVTATAAGPAFEGGITAGVFGADLVSMTAELLDRGVLDETGLLQGEAFAQGAVVYDSPGRDRNGIRIKNEDIRKLQLAKAAVAAGVEMLAVTKNTNVCLAGGFGYYLDPDSACRIGLLPGIEKERIQAVGNIVPTGIFVMAEKYLADDAYAGKVMERLRSAEVINLAESPDFNEIYLRHINF